MVSAFVEDSLLVVDSTYFLIVNLVLSFADFCLQNSQCSNFPFVRGVPLLDFVNLNIQKVTLLLI